MNDNKVHSAPVLSRKYVDNYFDETEVCTKEQKESFQKFGKECIQYATIFGIFDENELFETKEKLFETL